MKLRKNSVDRLLRGGCYVSDSGFLRVSFRNWLKPEYRGRAYGFRFVVRRQK